MRRLILLAILAICAMMLLSCETPGVTSNPDMGNHSKYKIKKYQYDSGSNDYVLIVERKDSLPVTNVTWEVQSGKTSHNVSAVIDENERPTKIMNKEMFVYEKKDIIMENDSIVIIRK
ncbi:MAG: hypothetical protein E6R13_05440 [Spirochaetes bacterium]|nr:MAG: hypothetical protein E6R13_05440 [Spirochaetota bacterium]